MRRAAILLLLSAVPLLAACPPSDPPPDRGLLGMGTVWPYPSAHLETPTGETETGVRVAIPAAELPISGLGEQTALDTARLNRLDGFPAVGTIVVKLPNQAIGEAGLPGLDDIDASLADDAPIRLLDMASGERLPYFAELDAYPDVVPHRRVLLIRPQLPLPPGGRVAVALTTDLQNTDGGPLRVPDPFLALRDGPRTDVREWLAHRFDAYQEVLDALATDGLPRSEVLLAWDFHVATTETTLAPFDRLLAAKREGFPADPQFDPGFVTEELRDRDEGDPMPPGAWRVARGTMRLPTFVSADIERSLDDELLPVLGNEDDVTVQVLVPESVRGAAAGSVPVLIFGHGLLSSPDAYLDDFDDFSGVIDLVDRLGMIAIGTEMRGLTLQDVVDAVAVALDFGRFPEITDRMLDGVTNTLLLERLPATDFANHAVFAAPDGSGSLIDPDTVRYYGISLGGIEGTVFMGNAERTPYGVLHVPGAVWSTMLERSSNWAEFEVLMEQGITDPDLRQLSYAVTQHFWDPVDPAVHALDGRLEGISALWQEAVGDEQVPNFTTEFLVRAVGAPLVTPKVHAAWGIDEVAAPVGPDAAGYFQMDPAMAHPPPGNRPAPETGAHQVPRRTEEHKLQIQAFFTPGAEGTIINPCDDAPCTVSAPE